jgi:hypothetical protein
VDDVVNEGDVGTIPVTAQEQALEILLGLLPHCDTKDGRPVVAKLRDVVYVAQNVDARALEVVN